MNNLKIAITADTHHGITSWSEIEKMIQEMSTHSPDIVLHAGDIGESRLHTDFVNRVFIALKLAFPKIPVGVIVGNHDLWVHENSGRSSKDLWDTTLPALAVSNNITWLENHNITQGGIAVVGSYLHYDYSAQDKQVEHYIRKNFPEQTPDQYYATFKHRHNNDGRFLVGLPADQEFARAIGKNFRKRLQEAEDNPSISQIMIVTHVPCIEQQITRMPDNFSWSIGNAYFGNLSHSKFILGLSKVSHIISAHTHRGCDEKIEADDGHLISVINIDADYGDPTFEVIRINEEQKHG